jgi:hypothetical protein
MQHGFERFGCAFGKGGEQRSENQLELLNIQVTRFATGSRLDND